jgi:DNA-binding MarR family transcriptional regulator
MPPMDETCTMRSAMMRVVPAADRRRTSPQVGKEPPIVTAHDAADDPRVLIFGRLLGAANGLEYLLGRAIEEEVGINHATFEVLLLLARAGDEGLALRDIAQARVLTSGGVTRMVKRLEQQGLVTRETSEADKRVQLLRLTPSGERTVVAAARVHVENVQRHFLDLVPVDQREALAATLRTLSVAAQGALPPLP